MNKRFFNALLLGAVVLSTGTFVSCDNDDVDDLKSRVSVIEVAIDDIKTQLSKALMTGASITKVDESNGTYTLTLSDGQKIVITSFFAIIFLFLTISIIIEYIILNMLILYCFF